MGEVTFEVSDFAEGFYGEKWYKCRVIAVNGDGTYNVCWTDEDKYSDNIQLRRLTHPEANSHSPENGGMTDEKTKETMKTDESNTEIPEKKSSSSPLSPEESPKLEEKKDNTDPTQ